MVYEIPFAERTLRFDLPPGQRGTLLTPRVAAPVEAWRAIREALRQPRGTPPLADLARAGDRVCLVVPDATVACPSRLLAPPLVTTLERAGVAKEELTILIATGARRPSTPAEKEELLGTEIVQRYKVIDHDARDTAWLVDLGEGAAGVPLAVNRRAVQADLLLAVGLVEPDPLTGFSGGAATVALGCAGVATLAAVDRLAANGGTGAVGELIREAAQRAGHRFALDVALDTAGRIVGVAAGAPARVHDELAARVGDWYRAPVDRRYDAAVLGLGWPYDLTLARALRTVLPYAPVVRAGGVLVLPAPLPEGVGDGESEVALERVLAGITRHRAVVVAGARDPAPVERLGVRVVPTLAGALDIVAARCGPEAAVLIVPRAARTIPVGTS